MMANHSARPGRSVAITGAGSGLGRALALGFAARRYIVFGTAMSAVEVQDLRAASGGRVSLTVCDTTKTEAVNAWAGGVSEAVGASGIDVVINNAGIVTLGPIELLPLDVIRHEFDVNVFSALAVINAFLPALRKSRGRIVQIGNWTTSVPLPFSGPSRASKAAIEVFSAVYGAELKSFGIEIVIAPVRDMTTGSASSVPTLTRILDNMTVEQRKLYGKTFATFTDGLRGLKPSGLESVVVAMQVIAMAEWGATSNRMTMSSDAEKMLSLARETFDAELETLRLMLVGLN